MKKEEIIELLCQFEQVSCEIEGINCWSARELYPILGYTQWHNFVNTVEKPKKACLQSGQRLTDHFAGVSGMPAPFQSPTTPFNHA